MFRLPPGTLQEIGSPIAITRAAVPEDVIKVGEGPFHREIHICDLDGINREVFPKKIK
jgi:hypothetical protein